MNLKTFVLSRSETSLLLNKLISAWPQDAVPNTKSIKVYQVEEGRRILVADEMIAVQIEDKIMPFLGAKLEMLQRFPSVTVDMGAIKFVCNGAKVMRPGITSFDSFKKGDIIVVKDQKHGKALAAGVALEDSETAKLMTKGYVVENLHYISDKMWEAYKEI
ncbi:MAG TPA: PUA domain-containing protein [Nitrososphaera sp.]|nr:PUA domain-containing protein [Nitrososphaera sp.]